jgi:hypothetical protein
MQEYNSDEVPRMGTMAYSHSTPDRNHELWRWHLLTAASDLEHKLAADIYYSLSFCSRETADITVRHGQGPEILI